MSRHVLVAVDDTEASRAAFEYALAEYPDATITVLHVFDPTHPHIYADATGGSGDRYVEFARAGRERGAALLEEVTSLAADRGREVRTVLEDGRAPGAIVDYAAEADVDHLVLGSRDGSASRLGTGSVCQTVAKRASVPVTIV
ncbi:universal stress protein [Natronococcus occultus]|uniref:Universal stress protein UspA-like protein n=1 Tax=Natronococcus occultus SP4 TaxID=694430 RepID=L0K573_9EURY|nr:universal stress protein [Natronococcus occultus]AGB39519.1 universal stress protein UspA-like protein [Natronococcus occultus SP4]